MESTANANGISEGRPVTVVFYQDGNPIVLQSHVVKGGQFSVETTDPHAEQVCKSGKLVLLMMNGATVHKAEAALIERTQVPNGWRLDLDAVYWQESDRRRYPRYGFKIPVTLRVVQEHPAGETQISDVRGETEDLSLGGAWVRSAELVEQGTLVEFRAILSETESVRALAVVAHCNHQRSGMGLEFVDYIGGARYHLHSFLGRAA